MSRNLGSGRYTGGFKGKQPASNLEARRKAYDASGKTREQGFTRPGSTNAHKQG